MRSVAGQANAVGRRPPVFLLLGVERILKPLLLWWQRVRQHLQTP